jgi:hypothetical protein
MANSEVNFGTNNNNNNNSIPGVSSGSSDAEERYRAVATDMASHWHPPAKTGRSPYVQRRPMCRGADFFYPFQEYIAGGGVGRYKNTAVMSMRINNV